MTPLIGIGGEVWASGPAAAALHGFDGYRLKPPFDSGLRDGKFNESLVHRRIVALRSRGRFGIPRLFEAIEGAEVIRGGHSWSEREFLRLVASAGLPTPQTQQVLSRTEDRLVRVDFVRCC